ncbi:hypothetical protein [Niabella aurantiaca]|uniref:hypothetical protein n=1 Tax=Niabella aurantiaca TaxID=379900 RepID=UPI00035D724C|nr:hypothetical protein [Niabella aurantiaca]
MKYLKIKNNGELDIRLVALMGGTTKANDKFKIGQFGTGLKYTLAFLYRNNLDFKIFSGEKEVRLHIEKEDIRGEQFEIICIDGNRTSITTRMGEDWLAWMIIRELWCNALDEGGAERCETEVAVGDPGTTSFYIQIDRQIENVIKEWDKYFIHNKSHLFKTGVYTVYEGGPSLRFYKNGVLIFENTDKPALYSYDISNADINELREYRGNITQPIVYCLSTMNKGQVSDFLDSVSKGQFEYELDWNWYQDMKEGWKEAIGSAKIITEKTLQTIKDRGGKPDEAGLIIVPESLYKKLCSSFEGIGATSVASGLKDFYEDYCERTESRIKQALTILESCGYVFHPELEFVYGFFEDKTTLAQVHLKTRKVYISKAFIQKPLFEVVAMLIEENEHFNTGLSDETRAFQQHFINLYTRQLLSKENIEI